jgi:hypothetical protein
VRVTSHSSGFTERRSHDQTRGHAAESPKHLRNLIYLRQYSAIIRTRPHHATQHWYTHHRPPELKQLINHQSAVFWATTSPSRVGATASAAVVVVVAPVVAGAGGVLLAEPAADDPLLDGASLGVRVPVGLLPLPGAVLPVHGAQARRSRTKCAVCVV